MTPYHFDNQRQKQKTSRTKIVGVILVVIILVGVIIFLVAPFVQMIARGPAWLRTSIDQSLGSEISRLTPKEKLIAENTQLKSDITNYQAQVIELQSLRDENEKLRTELSYVEIPNEFIIASIIAKPNQSLYNSIIIDRGSDDGIYVGQWVIAHGTIGLGKVSAVTNHTATVSLFSNPEFSGDMVIKNQDITVPATGRGGGNFEIHIPREITITDGDILAFPDNQKYAIGIVKSVTFDPRDPFQTVLARTPINVQELGLVEVVR